MLNEDVCPEMSALGEAQDVIRRRVDDMLAHGIRRGLDTEPPGR